MRWTHLKPAEGRRMPWKNGGGETLELAVAPPGATLATGFHWRLSSAAVTGSGPFSAFPGLDRWLLLLEGAGFELDFGKAGLAVLTDPLVPVRFPGDWPAVATLLEGPCLDLNLMVDPRACHAELRVLPLAGPHRLSLRAPTTLLCVARGTLVVADGDLHLGRRHTLQVEAGAGALQLVPGYGGARLVVIELRDA